MLLLSAQPVLSPVINGTRRYFPKYVGTFTSTAAFSPTLSFTALQLAKELISVVCVSGKSGHETVREDGGGGADVQRSQSALPGWAGRAVHAPGEARRPECTERRNYTLT